MNQVFAVKAAELPRPEEKQQRLLERLGKCASLLVAFSGGADSAYLAWAAHSALGNRALAVTALSPSFSAHDRQQAEAFVRKTAVAHEFIETREFQNPLYTANNADRCYHCKAELFTQLDELAAARGFAAVAYGINADDTQDFRPGHRAAAEHRVLAPLLDAGLRKHEIRELSRLAGLPTWDRPASACLSSRVPYGTPVTVETLSLVERAETILRDLGFRQFRVRFHQDLARIEIAPEEMPRALSAEMAQTMASRFKQLGFAYVSLDLEGYRQGSLNAALKK
ncbi:MAG TPA: ATP-dependent sacrificial sulfur transferase LarE [Candidatus Acidoferrales bacterium]|nr:ATP-dependent sacrificial sulfur transferase LarE [Candidatus Acidoferrales bacterium]